MLGWAEDLQNMAKEHDSRLQAPYAGLPGGVISRSSVWLEENCLQASILSS
jgi:hypothetical protein